MKRLYTYVIFWFALSLFTYADGPDEIVSENVSEEMVSGNVSVQTDSEDVPTETVSEDVFEKASSEDPEKMNCAGEAEKELPRMNPEDTKEVNSEDIKKMDEEFALARKWAEEKGESYKTRGFILSDSEDAKKMDEEFDLARKSAEKIWMSYKEDVFTSEYKANEFLDIVYSQNYKDYECLDKPLIAFKYFLLKSFLVEAQKRYNLPNTDASQKQQIAMRSFLISFAASCYIYFNIKSFAEENTLLRSFVLQSLKESYSFDPVKENEKREYQRVWKERQCKVDWQIAIQLCRYWSFINKNMEIMKNRYWQFLRLNQLVNGWPKK